DFTTIVDWIVNEGLDLDGNDAVSIAAISLDDFTVATWFQKTDSAEHRTFLGSSSGNQKLLLLSNGNLYFRAEPSSSSLNDNVGYVPASDDTTDNFLVIRRTGSTVEASITPSLAVNVNTLVGLGGTPTLPGTFTFDRIGRNLDSDSDLTFWLGILDEMKIFDRALSSSEIQALYDAGPAIP
ncbi:MAG: LamG-like jellyroll fold domain-containing protein, partial [Nitrososphaerales archaeon]